MINWTQNKDDGNLGKRTNRKCPKRKGEKMTF